MGDCAEVIEQATSKGMPISRDPFITGSGFEKLRDERGGRITPHLRCYVATPTERALYRLIAARNALESTRNWTASAIR